MAAILDSDDALDLKSLAQGVIKSLPPYSRPLFVRRVKEMEMTGRIFLFMFFHVKKH